MRKIIAILLAFTLCFTSAFICIAANGDHGEIFDYGFLDEDETIMYTVYEDGTAFLEGNGEADLSELWYYVETLIIGEGITDVIGASSDQVSKYVVDENNPYLSSDDDGVLYNKDKTVLIAVPGSHSDIYTVAGTVKTLRAYCFNECSFNELIIPESVETIESYAFSECSANYIDLQGGIKVIPEYAFYQFKCKSIIIPESVERIEDNAFGHNPWYDYWWWLDYNFIEFIFVMNPECEIEGMTDDIKIIGYSNSKAQEFAKKNGNLFDSLDAGHNHIYLRRTVKEATCTEGGTYVYNCPCGNATPYTETIEAYGHSMDYDDPAADGNVYCRFCGLKADCTCICHEAAKYNALPLKSFIYKVYNFIWKLFKINKECRCGYVYHY